MDELKTAAFFTGILIIIIATAIFVPEIFSDKYERKGNIISSLVFYAIAVALIIFAKN